MHSDSKVQPILLYALTVVVLCCCAPTASAQGSNTALQPANMRRTAPELALPDSEGKHVNLAEYRGKVVILDFWATWCHGCKEEIPWFSDFEQRYRDKGARVIGVSLDDDGWKVVRPFIKAAAVPYRIVLGNDSVAKAYAIGQMPDTFLIDRNGRVAATYVGMVNKDNLERNLRTLLQEK